MKNKNIISLLLITFVCINLPLVLGAYTSSSVVETNYNFLGTPFIDGNIHQTGSIVLRINTPVETTCTYWNSSIPITSFDGEYGLTHEAYLSGLGEGFHEYNISCGTNSTMEVDFATSTPISATIKISERPPLKEGKYTIDLVTSKTSLDTPTLEYSFDELVYKPISLTGSGTNWEGNLIIPASIGEVVCSFRFSARELSGEVGTEIYGDNLFIVDTTSPSAIAIINAVGYEGQIQLNWFDEEKVKEFNIYRSENPQVDYTEFYKTSSKNSFYDNDVEKGKTYYYRVAGVDEAGNIGDLSKEVYATALLSNYSGVSGLSPMLVGKVDNSIAEIDSVIQDINGISSSINLKDEKEKNLFTDIQLDKALSTAISELNSLKRDVGNYKLQDLSETELNAKLDAATLKLNIIKKDVPEDITIVDEKQVERDLNETNIQRAFLEYSSDPQYDYSKEIAATLKLITDKNIKITSNFYDLQIMYMDGTNNEITLVEDTLASNIDKVENLSFIISVPKEIAAKSSELKIINLNYNVIKDDPVISFDSSTKNIIYYLNKKMDLSTLEGILVAPIQLSDSGSGLKITGNSILNSASKGSWGIIALIIFAFVLIIYFLKIKNESSVKPVLIIIEEIKKSKELLKNGKEEEAKEMYKHAKEGYKTLTEKERKFVMESIKDINEEMPK